MKPQKLTKSKRFKLKGVPNINNTYGEYHEEDVKAAKEWLIQQIKEAEPTFPDKGRIIKLIHQAFEL